MGVRLHLECGGCDATAMTDSLRKRFVSISGKTHGFGAYHIGDPEKLTPAGWVMFDDYTQQTYCPDCWSHVRGPEG